MIGPEGTVAFVARLPFPWPPPRSWVLQAIEGADKFELTALPNARLSLTIGQRSFISQPIDINSARPRFVVLLIAWSASTLRVRIAQQELLEDSPGVPILVLPPPRSVAEEISTNDPNAVAACQKWIQNRKAKFAQPASPRPDRRLKTTDEYAHDLRASIHRLRLYQQLTLAGQNFVLGTLAGELRACLYWTQDAQRERSYNPLLLRMASLADLPLPVYFVPEIPTRPSIPSAQLTYELANAPRTIRLFATDQVHDLQESLISTVLQFEVPPARNISARDLIKELAHTMGAAHYDEDASEFLDALYKMKTSRGDQLTILICQIADAVASLSEWVLSELKTRNLIP
jgi:hypothetical protein